MSLVEQLLKASKEREKRRDASILAVKELPLEDRCAAAVAIVTELPSENLHNVLTQLIRYVETQGERKATNEGLAKSAASAKEASGTPPHVAGRMILNGVGEAPPKAPAPPALTLSTAPKTRTTDKRTQRDFIREVLLAAKRDMGTTEMVNGVMVLAPELKFESVKAEVARMRLDGLLIVVGTNGRGGLHRLTTETERAEIVAARAAKKEHLNGVS
jgi:hypothetical protein